MAQESNLWQAEGGSIPGQMGNPLAAVDGYYGHKANPSDPAAYWQINWDESDCGYGVGQVTDGMRLAGHEKPARPAWIRACRSSSRSTTRRTSRPP